MWKLVQNRSVVLQGPVGAFFASIGPAASTRVSVAAAVDDESRADSERMAVLTHTTLPAKIVETLHPREFSVEGGEVSGS